MILTSLQKLGLLSWCCTVPFVLLCAVAVVSEFRNVRNWRRRAAQAEANASPNEAPPQEEG